jgi:hypothetical protein
VPLSTQLSVLFGGAFNQIGWLIFTFGMIFFWPFAPNPADLLPRDWVAASAQIALDEETGASVNETSVWGYVYDYEAAGGHYSGRAFTTGRTFSKGQTVDIEYDRANPARSRLVGARSSHFPAWVGLVTLVFALPGFVMILHGLRAGARHLGLLENGHFTHGKLASKRGAAMTVNDQRVYELTFAFTTQDGRQGVVRDRTHDTRRLEDEALELVLYSPDDPSRAVLYDTIPNAPIPMRDGSLAPIPVSSAKVLIAPAIGIFIHGGILLYKLLG